MDEAVESLRANALKGVSDRGRMLEVISEDVGCWRRGIEQRYGLKSLEVAKTYPDAFINVADKKKTFTKVGKAMLTCASRCTSDKVIFLEEDWEIITRPASLVKLRIKEVMDTVKLGSETKATDVIKSSPDPKSDEGVA